MADRKRNIEIDPDSIPIKKPEIDRSRWKETPKELKLKPKFPKPDEGGFNLGNWVNAAGRFVMQLVGSWYGTNESPVPKFEIEWSKLIFIAVILIAIFLLK